MRLLFALPHVPWPPIGGGRTRSFYLSSLLTGRHEVHVLALRTKDDVQGVQGVQGVQSAHAPRPTSHAPAYASLDIIDVPTASPPRYSREWLSLRVRSLRHPAAAFYRGDVADRLTSLVSRHRPGVIVYGMSWMLPYALAHRDVPGVVDEQNYDPLITERMATGREGFDALKWKAYVRLTAMAERRNLKLIRGVAACSEEDAAIFRREAPHADVQVVPNGVDLDAYSHAPRPTSHAPVIVMTGSYSYAPNEAAARRLATRIFPIVRAAMPDAQLRLVGLNGESVLAELGTIPGVTVVGTVDDVRPELLRAGVAAAPIDTGGGTRLKILEAMAAGLPVVATRIGAEGIALEDGRDILLRDDDESFARALLELLGDAALAERMGEQGRQLVRRRYDWRASADAFDALLARVAA